jgi:hypothetical protein
VFDAEAAWEDLQEVIASREGWGRDRLLAEMAKLQTKHRIVPSLFERMMRLYRGRLVLVPASQQAEVAPAGEPEAVPPVAKEDAAPIEVRGGRDDERRTAAAAAG